MGRNLASLFAGLLFGAGLAIAQMINPEKIIGFLDVTGNWDPTLMVVLAAALTVNFIGYRLTVGRGKPVFAEVFRIPTRRDIGLPLVVGSALFGIGWGLGGYCPGPGISALSIGTWEPFVFVAAMAAGMLLAGFVRTKS